MSARSLGAAWSTQAMRARPRVWPDVWTLIAIGGAFGLLFGLGMVSDVTLLTRPRDS